MRNVLRRNDIGAIGIGTLIIFIALILVSAIAAAVIIKTAEQLEQKAEMAAKDANEMVRNTPDIKMIEGDISNAAMIKLYFYIDLYGTEGVDMKDVMFHFVAMPNNGNGISKDLKFNDATPAAAPTGVFYQTEEIIDPLNTYDTAGTPARFVLGERTLLKITVDLTNQVVNLPPYSTLQITTHVTTSGHTRINEFYTPTTYPPGGIIALEG